MNDTGNRQVRRGFARFVTLHVLFPLSVGGLLYILWRSDSLVMFDWFHGMGLGRILGHARAAATPASRAIPDWFADSFPDGAWAYAGAAFFGKLWQGTPSRGRVFWMGLCPAVSFAAEIGQALGVVPGTFDPVDLVMITVGSAAALCVSWWDAREPSRHKRHAAEVP